MLSTLELKWHQLQRYEFSPYSWLFISPFILFLGFLGGRELPNLREYMNSLKHSAITRALRTLLHSPH